MNHHRFTIMQNGACSAFSDSSWLQPEQQILNQMQNFLNELIELIEWAKATWHQCALWKWTSEISRHHQMLSSRLIWLRQEWQQSFLQDNKAQGWTAQVIRDQKDRHGRQEQQNWTGRQSHVTKSKTRKSPKDGNNDVTIIKCHRNWAKLKNTEHRQRIGGGLELVLSFWF